MQQVSRKQKLPNNKFCHLNFCRYVPGKAPTNPKIWLINCWHTGIDQFLYVNRINEGPQKYDWSIVDMQKGGDGGGSKLVSASGRARQASLPHSHHSLVLHSTRSSLQNSPIILSSASIFQLAELYFTFTITCHRLFHTWKRKQCLD